MTTTTTKQLGWLFGTRLWGPKTTTTMAIIKGDGQNAERAECRTGQMPNAGGPNAEKKYEVMKPKFQSLLLFVISELPTVSFTL